MFPTMNFELLYTFLFPRSSLHCIITFCHA